MLIPNTARKINSLCSQFALQQSVDEPTRYTETSPSLIDLILVHNPNTLIASGVGDPFLNQALGYHCPVFGLVKFSKPKVQSYTRHIWNYDQGDFQLLRTKAAETGWASLRDDNLDTYLYTANISKRILLIAQQCIPNRVVRIKPVDPPWLTLRIKKIIRKRKRAYKKRKSLTRQPTGLILNALETK